MEDKPTSLIELFEQILTNMVPDNLFLAMANTDVLPLIVFSLVFGGILTTLGEKGTVVIRFFEGVNDAICRSAAKKVYICNLMTKPGETSGFNAASHVGEILKYIGKDCLDFVIISDTRLSASSKEEYLKKGQVPVAAGNIDDISRLTGADIILADVGDETELVRHDEAKMRKEIMAVKALLRH